MHIAFALPCSLGLIYALQQEVNVNIVTKTILPYIDYPFAVLLLLVYLSKHQFKDLNVSEGYIRLSYIIRFHKLIILAFFFGYDNMLQKGLQSLQTWIPATFIVMLVPSKIWCLLASTGIFKFFLYLAGAWRDIGAMLLVYSLEKKPEKLMMYFALIGGAPAVIIYLDSVMRGAQRSFLKDLIFNGFLKVVQHLVACFLIMELTGASIYLKPFMFNQLVEQHMPVTGQSDKVMLLLVVYQTVWNMVFNSDYVWRAKK